MHTRSADYRFWMFSVAPMAHRVNQTPETRHSTLDILVVG